jgi:hypothetical protein
MTSLPRKVDVEDAHVLAMTPPHTTPRNTHAHHQSRVSAGTKSKLPQMATFTMTPLTNVQRHMYLAVAVTTRPVSDTAQ